jgi:hypothetical protein
MIFGFFDFHPTGDSYAQAKACGYSHLQVIVREIAQVGYEANETEVPGIPTFLDAQPRFCYRY